MNGECCGSREEGQANDIPATLVMVYYTNTNLRKVTCSNPKLDLVNINVYLKFGGILSIW